MAPPGPPGFAGNEWGKTLIDSTEIQTVQNYFNW